MAPHLALAVAVSSFLLGVASGNVNIDLGSCQNFVVEAQTAVNFNGESTTVTSGSVGITPGTAVVGSYVLEDGITEINNSIAQECSADFESAYDSASQAVCPPGNNLGDLLGLTLTPGVYCSDAITFSASTLTLDGQGDIDAQWVFQSVSTLSTATGTSFILINGAQESNVYWAVGSSVEIGYASSFVGTVMAQATITARSNSIINGRLLASTAITFESGSSVNLPTTTTSTSTASGISTPVSVVFKTKSLRGSHLALTVAVPLGACSSFAIQAGAAATFNGKKTTITSGDLGVSPGNFVDGSYQLLSGSVEIVSPESVMCAGDRILAYNALAGAVCFASQTRTELSGLTLTPGVYCSGSALTLSAASLTLDARGNADAQWIFQAGSAIITSPHTSIILTNGAQAKNIFWKAGSSVTLGYSSSFVGTIIAYASISFDYESTITGRALAGAAVSFASSSTVGLPQ